MQTSSLATRLVLGGIALLAVIGLAYCHGVYDVDDQISQFANRVQEIGLQRGVQAIPTEGQVQEQVQAIADDLDITVENISVDITPLNDSNMDRADLATQIVHGKLSGLEHRMPAVTGSSGGTRIAEFEHTATLIEVHARVHVSSFPYSRTEQVDTSRTVGHQMQMH